MFLGWYGRTPFGTEVAGFEMRRFESHSEAVMWKITTRGFTLQEVLILAAMNIASAAMAVEKRGPGASQYSTNKEHTCSLKTS
jgi:hypothetical protein